MTHKFDYMDDQDWFAEDKSKWFNGKTDSLPIAGDENSQAFRKTPFAQGYSDAYQLGMYDNPFVGDDEADWNLQYCEGWEFGQRMKQEKAEKYNALWS